jgi:hypothetical protein
MMRMVSVLTKEKPIPPPPVEPLVKDDEVPVPRRK